MRKTGMRFTWETTKNGDAINELKRTISRLSITTLGNSQPTFTALGFLKKSILNTSKVMYLKSA